MMEWNIECADGDGGESGRILVVDRIVEWMQVVMSLASLDMEQPGEGPN